MIDRLDVEITCAVAWDVLRAVRGKAGRRDIRTGAWRALRDAYRTEAGASVGPMERLVLAGSVWPAGRDE